MEETIVLLASVEHLNTISILAKLISKHNPFISVVILTTATAAAAPSVTYHRLPTPALPPDATTDHVELIFEISRLNNPNILDALHEISGKLKIKAFIIDFFCNPSFEIPASLNIPTYFYVSCGGFYLCYLLYLPSLNENVPGNIGDLNDILEIPGCPPIHPLDLPKSSHFRRNNVYKLMQKTAINMQKSSGIIVNSFDALEFRAKEALSNGLCIPNASTPPVYFVGPLIDKTINPNGDLKHECLLWLDSQPSKSVIFLCFGRRGLFSTQQLKDIATGLENSGHRFLWSLRIPHGKANEQDLNDLLPKGFVERTKDKGLVFVSWAPQKEVLGHGSVAGFVTHCGRSSILEALSFGVPMIGWPLYAEQRLSRVCMVEEMKVALMLEEAPDGSVGAGELEKRVKELMDSETGRAVRRRVVELKVAAQAAVGKNGSSLIALERFIESVTR